MNWQLGIGASLLSAGVIGILLTLHHPDDTLRGSNDRLLEIIPAVLDLGSIPRLPQEASVEIYNHDAAPIRLLHVQRSCNCTEVHVPCEAIASGKACRLTLFWTPTSLGPASTYFELFFVPIDGVVSSVRATVRADVLEPAPSPTESMPFPRRD